MRAFNRTNRVNVCESESEIGEVQSQFQPNQNCVVRKTQKKQRRKMTPLRVFIGCALLALAAGEAAAAAADDVKHITVFNNGAASGGVELRVTRAEARDWPALLARIQHALPVGDAQCSSATAPLTRTLELQLEKRHAAPGATAVAALYSARGERVAAFDALRAGERHYAVPDDLLFVWPFVHVGNWPLVVHRRLWGGGGGWGGGGWVGLDG